MFQLSQTHNQAFQAKAEADFVREVMQYLRENHAETIVKLPNGEFTVIDLPEETLQQMVEVGIAKARGYGLIRRRHLISFVVVMVVSAPNFDKHPKANHVLTSKYLIPSLRFDSLWIEISNEMWKEIENIYDSSEWKLS